MAQPFLGEIRIISFNYAPKFYAFCSGQILIIAQNSALFALLGTTYGGNGQTTFALPDLRGRIPIGAGQGVGLPNWPQGTSLGQEAVTLTAQQLPTHSHALRADAAAATSDMPTGRLLARGSKALYAAPTSPVALSTASVGANAGGQPHENRMPFLALHFVICISGIFPSIN
jgi:microcystin-dependent protein